MPSLITSDNGVSSGSAGLKTTAASDGALALQTTTAGGTATTAVTIDTSQNVGVGVTPSNAWAGTTSIETQSLNLNSISTSDVRFMQNAYYNVSTTAIYKTTNAASMYRQASGAHQWFNAASGTAGNSITWTQAMTLDASGNLLLGTTTQSGSAKFTFQQTVDTTVGGIAIVATDGNGANISRLTDGGLTFRNGGAERARIDSSGNLLVGKTASDTSSAGATIVNQSGTYGRINLVKSASGTVDALANYYSGTYVGGLTYSNTATAIVTSSDIRLKKDIVDAGSASTKIDQIRIVSHGWKHDDDVVEFGVIAQELNSVVPQAVVAGDSGEEIEKTWGVDYSKLIPILIKAHQEQQAIITQLQADVAALKGNA